MNGNKIILIAAIILGVFLLIPIGFYIAYFYNHIISKDPANWGVFGDFFGGILNPIVALLNILVFLYLTRVISQSDEKAQERNLEYQRELILTDLRHSAYFDVIKEMDLISEQIYSKPRSALEVFERSNKIADLRDRLTYKLYSIRHLFKVTNNSKYMSEILDNIYHISTTIIDSDSKALNQKVDSFLKHKVDLLEKLQSELLK